MIFESGAVDVRATRQWSQDDWYMDQKARTFLENEGPWVMREGAGEGIIVGGNLGTFHLLQGTEYMPSLRNKVLFIEDVTENQAEQVGEFDRLLQSLVHIPGFREIKALVIGRFQSAFGMTREKLAYILETKREMPDVPIVANMDFGHTNPIFTFPIGGVAKVCAQNVHTSLSLTG